MKTIKIGTRNFEITALEPGEWALIAETRESVEKHFKKPTGRITEYINVYPTRKIGRIDLITNEVEWGV